MIDRVQSNAPIGLTPDVRVTNAHIISPNVGTVSDISGDSQLLSDRLFVSSPTTPIPVEQESFLTGSSDSVIPSKGLALITFGDRDGTIRESAQQHSHIRQVVDYPLESLTSKHCAQEYEAMLKPYNAMLIRLRGQGTASQSRRETRLMNSLSSLLLCAHRLSLPFVLHATPRNQLWLHHSLEAFRQEKGITAGEHSHCSVGIKCESDGLSISNRALIMTNVARVASSVASLSDKRCCDRPPSGHKIAIPNSQYHRQYWATLLDLVHVSRAMGTSRQKSVVRSVGFTDVGTYDTHNDGTHNDDWPSYLLAIHDPEAVDKCYIRQIYQTHRQHLAIANNRIKRKVMSAYLAEQQTMLNNIVNHQAGKSSDYDLEVKIFHKPEAMLLTPLVSDLAWHYLLYPGTNVVRTTTINNSTVTGECVFAVSVYASKRKRSNASQIPPCTDCIEEPEKIVIRRNDPKTIENVFDDCGDDLSAITTADSMFVAIAMRSHTAQSQKKKGRRSFKSPHADSEFPLRSLAVTVSTATMYDEMRIASWPMCRTRTNVTPHNVDHIRAMALGVVLDFASGPAVSRHTARNERLTKTITAWMKKVEPAFKYSTIQLNYGYASRIHVDHNNRGDSRILALGQFQGGDLWCYDPGGNDPWKIKESIYGFPQLQPGDVAKGKTINIRNRILAFNGRLPHATGRGIPSYGSLTTR